jgi:hypothetical protein
MWTVEQRQVHDRTTPALLGLFSLVTLWAEYVLDGGVSPRRAAWYPMPQPSFSDALAAVRYRLWTSATFSGRLRLSAGWYAKDRRLGGQAGSSGTRR